MKVKQTILLFVLIIAYFQFLNGHMTTKDKRFKKIYNPTYIKDGDGKTFPKDNEFAFVHISIFNPFTQEKYHSTEDSKRPYLHLIGHHYPTAKCFGEVIEKMTLGEKTYFICPPASMFGDDLGLGGLIPGGIDLGVLIELLEIYPYDTVMRTKDELDKMEAEGKYTPDKGITEESLKKNKEEI